MNKQSWKSTVFGILALVVGAYSASQAQTLAEALKDKTFQVSIAVGAIGILTNEKDSGEKSGAK